MSAPSHPSRRLLLVGVDAADWNLLHPLLDAGQLPALNRMVEGGASGRLLSAAPLIGAAQWVSLATGKRPWQHGVCQSSELAADGRSWRPVTAASPRSPVVWEMLARHGKRCIVVGWPATHGAKVEGVTIVSDAYSAPTAGPGISPWPSPQPGTYWPENLAARLDRLRVSPEQIQADVISLYLPQWQKIDQRRDQRLGQLRLHLAADYSYLAALSELLNGQGWDFAAVRFPAMGNIARIFLPYHPPRRPSVSEQDFSLYGEVMRSAGRMLDLMLQRLSRLMGPETAIILVSGHGLRAFDAAPPGPPLPDAENWKSPYGVFAACGPGFAPDALLHGATVMDVAPTVLTWFGLPLGDDMEGRVLMESFVTSPEVNRMASWDSPHPKSDGAANVCGPEWNWNFIQSCLEAGQIERAMPVLEQLFREYPERPELAETLFECQLELKRLVEASQTMEVLLEGLPPGPAPLLLRAQLAWAQRDVHQARSLVQAAMKFHPTDRSILGRMGMLLWRLREWDRLEEVARQGIALDDREPIAWLGLATALLRKHQPAEAAEAAQRAISLKFFLPDAHFILVRALVAQGHWDQAREALQTLEKIQPNNRVAASYARRIPSEINPVQSGSS